MRIRLLAASLTLAGILIPFVGPVQAWGFIGTAPANSASGSDPGTVKLVNPLDPGGTGNVTIPVLIGRIVNTALGIVGTLAFLMFIWGGFNWLVSGGSAERIEKGKNAMVYASIGIVIVFASYALVRFVLSAFSKT